MFTLSNQHQAALKRPTVLQMARQMPKRGVSARAGAVGLTKKQAYLEKERSMQVSLDAKTTKDRISRLRQTGMTAESDFRSKYATQTQLVGGNLQINEAPHDLAAGDVSGGSSDHRKLPSSNLGLIKSVPSATADILNAKRLQSDYITQPKALHLAQTLTSKPGTAELYDASRIINATTKTSSFKHSQRRKTGRNVSGRSGGTVGIGKPGSRTRANNYLTIDSQNNGNRFGMHGSSQPTTAMSLNHRSDYFNKTNDFRGNNGGASSPPFENTNTNGHQSSLRPIVPEIFHDEMLINVDLSPSSTINTAQPQRYRARTRNNKEDTIDSKATKTQELYLEDNSQIKPATGGRMRTQQSTLGRVTNNSRLIISGNKNYKSVTDQNYMKKEDNIDAFFEEFYEKNKGKAPQVVIDRLRKQIDSEKQEGDRLRERIQQYDKTTENIKRQTKDQKDRSQQALSDKFEIMRDLATYEHNFSMQRSAMNNMNLRERLMKSIAMIQDTRNYCNKSLSLSELEKLRQSHDNSDVSASFTEEVVRPNFGFDDQSRNVHGGFEAQKNYLLNLIQTLENYKQLRQGLENNRLPLLDEQDEKDLQISQSTGQDGSISKVSKDQVDSSNIRGKNLDSIMNDSRIAIDKMKQRRHYRLIKLMNMAQSSTTSKPPPTAMSPLVEPEDDPVRKEQKSKRNNNLQKSAEKKGNLKQNDEKAEKSAVRNPCLAINSAYSRDEQLYTRMTISGLDCLVQALYHNGLIKGQVSVSDTSEQLKFDLHPVLNERFHAVNIANECQRIYFDVHCDAQGTLFLKLLIKNKTQYLSDRGNKQNFILKLYGSRNYMSSLEIINDVSQYQFNIQTKVFNTINLKQQEIFEIKNEIVQQNFSYKQMAELLKPKYKISLNQMENVRLGIIANFISKNMCIYQKQDRQYAFRELNQACNLVDYQDSSTKHINRIRANRSRIEQAAGFSDMANILGYGAAARVVNSQEKPSSVGKDIQTSEQQSQPKDNNQWFDIEKKVQDSKNASPQMQSLVNFAESKEGNEDGIKIEVQGETFGMGDHFEDETMRRNMIAQRVGRIRRSKWQEDCLIDYQQLKYQIRRVKSYDQLSDFVNQKNQNQHTKKTNMIVQSPNVYGSFNNTTDDQYVSKEAQPRQPQNFYLKRSNTETSLELVVDFKRQYMFIDIAQIKQNQKQNAEQQMQKSDMMGISQTIQNQYQIINIADYHEHLLTGYERKRIEREQLKQQSALEVLMEIFNLYYVKRLINSSKRFKIVANQKQKLRKLERERVKDQVMIYQDYKEGLKEQFENLKNREQDQSSYQKRKYHRLAKIYQRNFIQLLYDSQKVIRQYDEPDPDNPAYKILFLFFQIRNQFCLLLGRDKTDGAEDGEDDESSQSDHISKTSSQLNKLIEVDDDSPYFLRITINPQFMFLLDDTNLPLTSEDIAEACKESLINIFRENRIFKDIVRREVQQMFKEKKIIDLQTGVANAVAAKMNATDLRKKLEISQPTKSISSQDQSSQPDQNVMASKDANFLPARKSLVPEKINEESEGTQSGRGKYTKKSTPLGDRSKPAGDRVVANTSDVKMFSTSDNRADIKGIGGDLAIDKRYTEVRPQLAEVSVSFDNSNLLKKEQGSLEDSPYAQKCPPLIDMNSQSSPDPAEGKEEAQFENAMNQIVGNFSIILNFNS